MSIANYLFRILSKFFLCLAIVSPIMLVSGLFFPFINGKVLLFRTGVELSLIFFLCYLATLKKLPNFKQFLNPLVIAVIIFGIVYVLTGFAGVSPWSSFWSNFERGEGGFQMLHYVAFFILLTLLFHSMREWKWLSIFSLLVGLLVLLYGFLQWLPKQGLANFDFIIKTGGRTSGTLGNPSYLGAYLLFQIPLVIWLMIIEKNKWLKAAWGLLAAFQVGMLFTTETQAAILSIVIALLLLLISYTVKIYQLDKNRPGKKIFFYWCYLLSFIFMVVVFGLILHFNKINLYDRIRPRLWTWGSAIEAIKERPLIGWGSENFPQGFDKYHNPNHFGGETWFDRTHNLFLEYLISGGIVLLISWLLIYFFYFKQLIFLPKNWFWPILLVVPISYFVQGLTLFDVLPVYLVSFFYLAFFINYSNNFKPAGESDHLSPRVRIAFYLLAAIGVPLLLFLLYFGNYLPWRKNLLIVNTLRSPDLQELIIRGKTAFNFYSPVGQSELYVATGRSITAYLQNLDQQKIKVDPQNQNFQELMSLNDPLFEQIKPRVVGIKDYYLNSIWNLAAFKVTNDEAYLAKAKSRLQEARQIAPKRMEVLLALLEVAQRTNDVILYNDLLSKIKEIRPDLVSQIAK